MAEDVQSKSEKKYSREDIHNMSFEQLCQTICDKLNDNDFEYYIEWGGKMEGPFGFSIEPNDTIRPGLVRIFLSHIPKDGIDYLREIGLLNNGRCALCGADIESGEYVCAEKNGTYHICRRCNLGLGPDAKISESVAKRGNSYIGSPNRTELIDRANNKGCLVAALLFPLYILKTLFFN